MRITDVRAHHVRIPYDAGVASFIQGASAISAIEIVLVEVSTDSGPTGWGDAFSYVCPRTTLSAINEMIAPQARGLEVPDAAGVRGSHPTQPASVRPLRHHNVMVDMNCPMTGTEAIAFAQACRSAAPLFLEEPVWPPEDFKTLAEVREKGGLAIAAGENACTVHQFRQMMSEGAVTYAQPSVTKVGGITEYLNVAALADEMGVRLAPHSPYFGPGFLATLQLMSLRDDGTFIEVFYMNRAACLWGGRIDVDAKGTVAVPDGPGLGYEPDRDVMERYRVV